LYNSCTCHMHKFHESGTACEHHSKILLKIPFIGIHLEIGLMSNATLCYQDGKGNGPRFFYNGTYCTAEMIRYVNITIHIFLKFGKI